MALEIILLICGVVCVLLSFIVDNHNNQAVVNQTINTELTDKQKEIIQNQINSLVEAELELINERTEISLDKISNVKIMEMNEYSETILKEINRTHNETIFLYDMLNEKAKEIKTTVKDVNVAKKQIQKMHAEVSVSEEYLEEEYDHDYYVDKENTASAMQLLTSDTPVKQIRNVSKKNEKKSTVKNIINLENIPISENDTNKETKTRKSKKSYTNDMKENVMEMNIQFEKGSNHNKDKILNLFDIGKSNKEIAKELSLGVGEVKLVIDLYNSGN